ncbi:uncharacterized protein LOC123676186 [Harmonia axyridis]|uniref:uncharacterized protein LOC123676186 n=1 Tax=Harmonia axyridis TaxID=115357 RepID=UPI001E275FE1|nr:uncharacterized protein LOC123676186 [Harmonia axyridis]
MLKRNVIILSIILISCFVLLLVLILTGNCCFKDRCQIPLNTFDRTPLFFNLKDGSFVYPEDDSIVLERDRTISIGCPGSSLNIGVKWTEMTCITETTFNVFDDNVDVTTMYCEDDIKSTARYTGKSCEYSGREIEVGFELGQDKFLRQMRICFDDKEQKTYYTEHDLTHLIDNHELSGRRPFFQEGNFFHVSGKGVETLYTRKVQRLTINKQLNLSSDSTDVIKDGDSSFFLSRGHLAPKGDFVYGSQQNASFYYVNAAPQWEIINSGSWNTLEWRIRSYVSRRGSDLKIFTGTYGNLVLTKYSSSPLYLYYNSLSQRGIPVPEVYWKVVYDPARQKGVAFVGTNDPFLTTDNTNFICRDVLKSIEWIKFSNKNASIGLIYACTVDNLRNVVNYVPKLTIIDLLTD